MRLSNEMINQRVKAAMQSLTETGKRPKIGGASFESLLQRAQQRRGAAKPGIKMSPEQRAALKAKALPTKREEETERW